MESPKVPFLLSDDALQFVAVLFVDFHIPQAQSLKEKRMVLRQLRDRVRNKFNVSVSEIDGQDKWQRSTFGFAMIGSDKKHIEKSLQSLRAKFDSFYNIEVLNYDIEFI